MAVLVVWADVADSVGLLVALLAALQVADARQATRLHAVVRQASPHFYLVSRRP